VLPRPLGPIQISRDNVPQASCWRTMRSSGKTGADTTVHDADKMPQQTPFDNVRIPCVLKRPPQPRSTHSMDRTSFDERAVSSNHETRESATLTRLLATHTFSRL